jgi:hypothetical protein
MNTHVRLTVVIALAGLLLVPPLAVALEDNQAASTLPTLSETLSWLRDRLAADGESYRPENFSTCTVSWFHGDGPERVIVNFANIDSSKVRTDRLETDFGISFRVLLSARENQATIRMEGLSPEVASVLLRNGNLSERAGGIYSAFVALSFRDAGIAERVARALTHAATLCANEPF